jgi:hypothetical protein
LAKISKIKQHQIFSRLGAFLLLLIFLSVPLIETLHHHVSFCDAIEGIQSTASHQSAVQKKSSHHTASQHVSLQKSFKNNSEKTLSASQVKCKLCDLIRNYSQHACLADQQTITFNNTFLQRLNWHFILQASSDFVLACANKGPPAFQL